MLQRFVIIALVAIGGFAFASPSLALGFGNLPDSIPFGQALDLSVPLRLGGGESPPSDCIKAEVHLGEQPLAPGAVAATAERRAQGADEIRLRIRSAVVVKEPWVVVHLRVGCDGALSRRFVVFVDPPEGRAEVSREPAARGASVAALPTAAASFDGSPPAPQPARQTPARARASVADASAVSGRRSDADRTAVHLTKSGASVAGSVAPTALAQSPTRAAPPALAALAIVPRATLQATEESKRAAAFGDAVTGAAPAFATPVVSMAGSTTSLVGQPLATAPSQLNPPSQETASQRASVEHVHTAPAGAVGPADTQTALLATVAALGALTLRLGWRVRSLQRERQAGRSHVGDEAAPERLADASPEGAPQRPVAAILTQPPAPAVTPAPALPQGHAAVLPSTPAEGGALVRPASVDELIDLEQEVEFFLVLGEEQSALDLLMAHLRCTQGAGPWPYLKLLEIHRRRGDRAGHQRVRMRLRQRHDSPGPDWDAAPDAGAGLHDDTAAMATLQRCWGQPAVAMAELERLLLHAPGEALFSLAAYRELLTLYLVARDLSRRVDDPMPDVDVLLPLPAHDGAGTTAPSRSIFDTLADGTVGPNPGSGQRAYAPLDLDLDEAQRPQDSRAPLQVALRRDD